MGRHLKSEVSVMVAIVALLSVNLAAQPTRPLREQDAIAQARSAVARFHTSWDSAWKASETLRHVLLLRHSHIIAQDAHCDVVTQVISEGKTENGLWIRSQNPTQYSVCPTWAFRRYRVDDEGVRLDNAIEPSLRARVTLARDSLLNELDALRAVAAATELLVGQQVRFALDQGQPERALAVTEVCASTSTWCGMLRGYTRLAAGDPRGASREFDAALARMTPQQRCRWLDASVLMSMSDSQTLAKQGCTPRTETSRWLLWLADPLWSDTISDRRNEHLARGVLLRMRSALGRDERYSWDIAVGSDARERMVMRYGWWSYAYWMGPEPDLEHTGWLSGPSNRRSPANEPYTGYEYSRPRMQTVPPLEAAKAPFAAVPSLLSVARLDGGDWPVEHMRISTHVQRLIELQNVLLRRPANIEMWSAIHLSTDVVQRPLTSAVTMGLWSSSQPDSAVFLSEADGLSGSTAVIRSHIASTPFVASIESPVDLTRSAPALRARFGVTPPAPLSALAKGAIAISDPALLSVYRDVDITPSHPDSALSRLLGTTALPPLGKLGIYWETYGIALTDTVDVAVWIAKTDEPGLLRRVGRAVRIVPGAETPVGVSWREPLSARNATLISEGPVPIIGRGLSLDLTTLTPGEYWVEVAVARPDQEPVRGRRTFRVLPP